MGPRWLDTVRWGVAISAGARTIMSDLVYASQWLQDIYCYIYTYTCIIVYKCVHICMRLLIRLCEITLHVKIEQKEHGNDGHVYMCISIHWKSQYIYIYIYIYMCEIAVSINKTEYGVENWNALFIRLKNTTRRIRHRLDIARKARAKRGSLLNKEQSEAPT